MDYKDLNDYELVYQVREKDDVAYGILLEKYSHLISMIAKKYYSHNKNIGLEYDDFYQEGMIGLMRALDDYEPSNTLFYTYATLCAKRQIETCIKGNLRMKHSLLNNSLPVNEPLNVDSDISLEELIPSDYSVEKEIDFNELYNKLINHKYDFSFEDSQVFELRLNLFTIGEISCLLCLTRKNVDYRLRKIRKKLLDIVSSMI